jgi:sec-independent protein translocase protein TatC
VFELPIAILLLSAFGLVTPKFLAKYRRHAILASYLVAAIITPGDLFVSSVALMVPLYLLYELSIVLSRLVHRSRERREIAEAEAERAAGEASA